MSIGSLVIFALVMVGLVGIAGVRIFRWKLLQSRRKGDGIAYHPGFNPFSYVELANPALSPPSVKLNVAYWFDKEDRMLRVAGVYSTVKGAEDRLAELNDGTVQQVILDQPVRFTFESGAESEVGK